jgi:hypothetical protein
VAVLIALLGFVLGGLALGGWISSAGVHIGWRFFSVNQAQFAIGLVLAGVVVGGIVGTIGHVVLSQRG